MACSAPDDNSSHIVVPYATFTEYRDRRHVASIQQRQAADANVVEVPGDAGDDTAAAICLAVAAPLPNGDRRDREP